MSTFSPNATTRTARGGVRHPRGEHLLATGELIGSPESGLRYRVGKLLGQGGFGQVFLATRVGSSDGVPEEVCVKVSAHMDPWLREAYFGLLLNDHPRAIRVFDRFPLMTPTADGQMLYCLVLERARHGD